MLTIRHLLRGKIKKMKKVLITIICSILLLVAGGIYEQVVVLKQFDEFKSSVAKCLDKANAKTLTVNDINELSTDWEDKRKYLHVFIPHTEIKEIGLWLSEATAFAEFGNMEETADKLQVIYDLSKQIPDNFRIKIENIM
jgi:hypothetical protein